MPEPFSHEAVQRLAALARLALREDEATRLAPELTAIVGYVQQIAAVDTSGVPATAQVLDHAPAEREDAPADGLPRPEALRNAPDAAREAGFFRTPRSIG